MRKFTAIPGKGIFASEENRDTQKYRVWYNPYGLDGDEEDCIDVEAVDEDEARRKARTLGYTRNVELIESSESASRRSIRANKSLEGTRTFRNKQNENKFIEIK